MAELTKIFTGMEKGPERINDNFDATSSAIQDTGGIACTKLNGINGAIAVRRVGKVVWLAGALLVPTTFTNLDAISFPTGFSPSRDVVINGFQPKNTDGVKLGALIMSGTTKMHVYYRTGTGSNAYYINEAWITDDDFPS